MRKKIFAAVLVVLLVVAGLAGTKALQIQRLIASGEASAPPPETVSTAVVRQEEWPQTIKAIGSITAVQGLMVTLDVPGMVREIAFESGAAVAQGDLLVRLDTSTEVAQLAAARTQAELAGLNVDRIRKLRAESTVSQAELDTAESAVKQYEAEADVIRAAIEKKTIRAPFSGRLGIRLINVGEYLEAGEAIVSLQSLEAVYADFSLPQQELARLEVGMRVALTTDAYRDRSFTGALTTINPALDPSTRSVGLQATFANVDQLLRPGMFARLEVVLSGEEAVMSIPATSVLSAPYGDSVYVLVPESEDDEGEAVGWTVRQQFIRTGRARGDFISVNSGLEVGDRIVNSGLFKLRNGVRVVENNELIPASSEAPNPSAS